MAITDRQFLNLPGVKLRHAYEKKKARVQNALYSSFSKALATRETPRVSNADIIETASKSLAKYMDKDGVGNLMGDFDIGRDRARGIKAKLMQKVEQPRQ